MSRFLITGLPRSRTAWLSVVADLMPGVTCVHEPLRWLSRWEDVGNIWQHGTGYVGVSDSGLGLHLASLLERFSPRTVIVVRPIDEVAESLGRIGLSPPKGLLELLWSRLEACRDHPLVRMVAFDDLAETDAVIDAFAHLMPDAVFDKYRIERMQGLNIQASPEMTIEVANQRIPDIAALLGQDVVEHIGRG